MNIPFRLAMSSTFQTALPTNLFRTCSVLSMNNQQKIVCFIGTIPLLSLSFNFQGMFPFVVQVAALGAGDYHVRVQATDTFNLTANYTVDFQGLAIINTYVYKYKLAVALVLQLEIECETEVDNDDVFTASCKTNNPNRFIMCSFNKEEPVPCMQEKMLLYCN